MPHGWPYDYLQAYQGGFGYAALLCPADRRCSGLEPLSGSEERGVAYQGGLAGGTTCSCSR